MGEFFVVEESMIGLVDGVEMVFCDLIGIGSVDCIWFFDVMGIVFDDILLW